MSALKELAAAFERASEKYSEAYGIARSDEWLMLKLQEEMGELTQMWMKLSGHGRRKGLGEEELRRAVADETADLFGMVMLFAHRHDIDLAAAIKRKWHFEP